LEILIQCVGLYGGDFNPYYQTYDDRIAHFNINFFHSLSKLSVATISHLAFYNIPTRLENKEFNYLTDFELIQNFPNPFNPITTIKFQIPNSEFVILKIYNILGKEVATLVSKKLNQGNHTYTFDGKNLASGVYYYQLVAGEYRAVKKMILSR
jgi:hypothetical protein